MAVNIPIWPGSSSFFPGNTPFGFYDYDYEFQQDADKIADWCAKRLGYPLSEVELQDLHFYTCFEEAITEYGAQLIAMTGGKQIYDLSNPSVVSLESGTAGTTAIEIKRLYHEAPPALTRFFDPFIGTGIGTQQMLDAFGFGSYSPGTSFMMMPIYADLLRLQAIEFNDVVRRSAYSFEISNNRLRIFPVPLTNNVTKVHFDYIVKSERSNPLKGSTGNISDFSNVPYENVVYENVNSVGRQWIRKYAAALSKEMLGNVRGKYSSIPIPNSEITLNGADLLSAAQTEKDALVTELKEMLDSMSRQAQLERKQAEADALQSQMNKMPLKIYIG